MNIICMRLIILKILNFVMVMWQRMWIISMSREFTSRFILYSYSGYDSANIWSSHIRLKFLEITTLIREKKEKKLSTTAIIKN
jgi:hypothetical protein